MTDITKEIEVKVFDIQVPTNQNEPTWRTIDIVKMVNFSDYQDLLNLALDLDAHTIHSSCEYGTPCKCGLSDLRKKLKSLQGLLK